jgi:hypothetical protein
MSGNSYFIIDNSGQQIPEAKTPDAICVLVQANVRRDRQRFFSFLPLPFFRSSLEVILFGVLEWMNGNQLKPFKKFSN